MMRIAPRAVAAPVPAHVQTVVNSLVSAAENSGMWSNEARTQFFELCEDPALRMAALEAGIARGFAAMQFHEFAGAFLAFPYDQALLCLAVVKLGTAYEANPNRVYLHALDRLIYETNVSEAATDRLVSHGLLDVVLPLVRAQPFEIWREHTFDPDAHPSWCIAFDVLTNVCKWTCVRPQLMRDGVARLLHTITQHDSYFGFEATEAMAYLVGGWDDVHDAAWLQPLPKHMDSFKTLFRNVMEHDHESLYGLMFGKMGRMLVVRRLAERQLNHALLADMVPAIVNELKSHFFADAEMTRLAALALADLLRSPSIRSAFLASQRRSRALWTVAMCAIEDESRRPLGLYVHLLVHGATEASANLVDHSRRTPLSYAVEASASAARELLRLGASTDVDATDRIALVKIAMAGASAEAADIIVGPVLAGQGGDALAAALVQYIRVPALGFVLAKYGHEVAPPTRFVDDAVRRPAYEAAVRRGRIEVFKTWLLLFKCPLHPLRGVLCGIDGLVRHRVFEFFCGGL